MPNTYLNSVNWVTGKNSKMLLKIYLKTNIRKFPSTKFLDVLKAVLLYNISEIYSADLFSMANSFSILEGPSRRVVRSI